MSCEPLPQEEEFMQELIALCKKYQIAIGACGCCESPWLVGPKEMYTCGGCIPNPQALDIEEPAPDPFVFGDGFPLINGDRKSVDDAD